MSDQSSIIDEQLTYSASQEVILRPLNKKFIPSSYYLALLLSLIFLFIFLLAVTYLFVKGTGIWGIRIPIGWGFAIVNFIWWVGIGHAGTFISAILLLVRQDWRTSINRFAEAMTLFAVVCAGLFPVLHLGRPWLFYWLFPYPNTMGLYPQFRSPLVWDAFAISSYALVSLLFWYVGLIPDLATIRDHSKRPWVRRLARLFSLGWMGSSKEWHYYETTYLILAGLATPLVLSVHSIVSFDFAVSIIPGWHATIFPPYFVAGAIYSGFAMIIVLSIPLRHFYQLQQLITIKHLENSAKLLLVSGSIVGYAYVMELFFAWYSGEHFEQYIFKYRMWGDKSFYFWLMILFNLFLPHLFWFKFFRTHLPTLFFLSLCILVGMWLERFVIVITSLERDYLPSSWDQYTPTVWDWATYLGTFGLFFFLFLLFIRFLPMISVAEIKLLLFQRQQDEEKSAINKSGD